MAQVTSMKVGDKFSSFEDFKATLQRYQEKNITQFVIRSADKLKTDDPLYNVFAYSKLRYECKQGDKVHQPDGPSQQRPKQRSFKVGCPVVLNVRLNRPKGGASPFLKITKLDVEHKNHPVSQEIFKLYPEQRRFAVDETDKVVLSSSTMRVAEQRAIIEKRHGTAVLTQDIYNVQRRNLLGRAGGGDDECKCEAVIKDVVDAGGYGEVGNDESGCFLFAVFQTKEMKDVLSLFPECLIMDCTYKVNNYLYPLLTIMAIDGEGRGLPVFHAFLAKEDRHIMEKCLHIFALQYNSALTACFIVDKDMAEIAAIGAVFPGVPVNLCQFHISQAVERYLRKELGRGSAFVSLVVQTFMKQVCTESEEEFQELKVEISQIVPQSAIQYFEENWWAKRHLWAACCNTNIVKLTATTTNTLESYHSKIKKTINEKLNLSNTLAALIEFNNSKIIETQRKDLLSSACEVYDHQDKDSVHSVITQSMTRFSGDLVKLELSLSTEISYALSVLDDNDYLITYKDRSHRTSVSACSCSTFGHLKIPCRHMFFLRGYLDVTLFDDTLVPQRFRPKGLPSSGFEVPSSTIVFTTISSSSTDSSNTVEGRFKQAKAVCDRIVNFLAILGKHEFAEKLSELNSLLTSWSTDSDAGAFVQPSVSMSSPSSTVAVVESIPVSTDSSTVAAFESINVSTDSSTVAVGESIPVPGAYSSVAVVESIPVPGASSTVAVVESIPVPGASSTVAVVESIPVPGASSTVAVVESIPVPGASSTVAVVESIPVPGASSSVAVVESIPVPGASSSVAVVESIPVPGASSSVAVVESIPVPGASSSVAVVESIPVTGASSSVTVVESIPVPGASSSVAVVESIPVPGASSTVAVVESIPVTGASSTVAVVESIPVTGASSTVAVVESIPSTSYTESSCVSISSPVHGEKQVTWPKMSKLFKPRGRPSTKQRFTKRGKLSVKRVRFIPRKFSQLTATERNDLLIRSVSIHYSVPNCLIKLDELKSFTDYSDTVLDVNADFCSVQHLFEPAAWESVSDGVASRRDDNLYYCGSCKELDDQEYKMVQCERCLLWYHFHCVGYSSKKLVEVWFCDGCV